MRVQGQRSRCEGSQGVGTQRPGWPSEKEDDGEAISVFLLPAILHSEARLPQAPRSRAQVRLFLRRKGTPGVVGTKAKFLAVGAWGLEGFHWHVGLG